MSCGDLRVGCCSSFFGLPWRLSRVCPASWGVTMMSRIMMTLLRKMIAWTIFEIVRLDLLKWTWKSIKVIFPFPLNPFTLILFLSFPFSKPNTPLKVHICPYISQKLYLHLNIQIINTHINNLKKMHICIHRPYKNHITSSFSNSNIYKSLDIKYI